MCTRSNSIERSLIQSRFFKQHLAFAHGNALLRQRSLFGREKINK